MNIGYLTINVYGNSIAMPLKGAKIKLNNEFYITNEFGQVDKIELKTIDKKYSLIENSNVMPYKTYDITVMCDGYLDNTIKGIEIFDAEVTILDVYLLSSDYEVSNEVNISPNTLYGNYPNTIVEINLAPKVLKDVVIPEYIIVHNGNPSDTTVSDLKVNFVDYIKNVACSEIYSTWPKETIKANVLAIMSFAINRIYTEWYKSRGYAFSITSTTTYDQKYTPGRPTFESINNIVDEVFTEYVSISNYPILTQYRSSTTTPNIMSQWGSKELGDKGYNYKAILEHYYGKITINKAKVTTNYPTSFSTNLKLGDCSDEIYILENQLNYIRGSYPGIPVISNANGVFDEETKNSVMVFQNVFKLPVTGIVDYATWYKISYVFVAINDLIKGIYY